MGGQLELPLTSVPKNLTLKQYAAWVEDNTDRNTDLWRIQYPILGILTEAGELADHLEKMMRKKIALDAVEIAYEAGDVLYYLTKLCNDLGVSLDDIAWMNMEKLIDRQRNGKR